MRENETMNRKSINPAGIFLRSRGKEDGVGEPDAPELSVGKPNARQAGKSRGGDLDWQESSHVALLRTLRA